MSQTFRRDPDASPFATRRAGFKRADKRATFEARREARTLAPRAVALANLDAVESPARGSL